MYCTRCGAALSGNAKFCNSCGSRQILSHDVQKNFNAHLVGFSGRINDPAFAKYIRNSNRWSVIFSIILAIAAILGFTLAGESGAEGMENPQAMFIGMGIGGMFLLIALFQVVGRKRSRTWDGVVSDKKIYKKRRRKNYGEDDYIWEDYTEYVVTVLDDSGKTHQIKVEDDDTMFNYYMTGDRVRHHAGLNSYEKYDKSNDTIIFCAACSSLNDIRNDNCFRCKCPLLK